MISESSIIAQFRQTGNFQRGKKQIFSISSTHFAGCYAAWPYSTWRSDVSPRLVFCSTNDIKVFPQVFLPVQFLNYLEKFFSPNECVLDVSNIIYFITG